MNNAEFYIGWMDKAPATFSKHLKKVLLLLLPVVLIIGYLIAASQQKFSTANFEFGTLTEVKGIYFSKPLPSLKIISKKDLFGNSAYITVPLVGFGKAGAYGVMQELQKEKGISLDNKEITLKGTLLYNDGKLLMQVDGNDQPLIHVGETGHSSLAPVLKELGNIKVKGEVVDPKCFFGVMKPGYGKVHKDCAIRCISGGIPPVLKVQDENGRANFYLIVGTNGEKMNDAVKDFVAEPVEIEARAVQQDDWIILYTGKEKIRHISGRALSYPGLETIACATACSK
ncbi:MAG: hypothetical protein ABIN01_22585 [Ferruginibacter sp.]